MAPERSYPTIWEVSDDLWETIQILLDEYDPPASTGRPRADRRPILNAIIYRFRSGCQWNHLPREFGDDSKIHRVFQHWVKRGIFEKIWVALLTECNELEQVQWDWQAADGWLGKARLGGDQRSRGAGALHSRLRGVDHPGRGPLRDDGHRRRRRQRRRGVVGRAGRRADLRAAQAPAVASPAMPELHDLTALDQGALLRRREVSAVELARHHLERSSPPAQRAPPFVCPRLSRVCGSALWLWPK